jgi:hypothetical protein
MSELMLDVRVDADRRPPCLDFTPVAPPRNKACATGTRALAPFIARSNSGRISAKPRCGNEL